MTHPYLMAFCLAFLGIAFVRFNRAYQMSQRSKQFVIRFHIRFPKEEK